MFLRREHGGGPGRTPDGDLDADGSEAARGVGREVVDLVGDVERQRDEVPRRRATAVPLPDRCLELERESSITRVLYLTERP